MIVKHKIILLFPAVGRKTDKCLHDSYQVEVEWKGRRGRGERGRVKGKEEGEGRGEGGIKGSVGILGERKGKEEGREGSRGEGKEGEGPLSNFPPPGKHAHNAHSQKA